MKNLPVGAWISLHGLDAQTVEADIIDVIAARTGVRLQEDQISINPNSFGASAIISFNNAQIRDFLNWALSEYKVCGRELHWRVPASRKPKEKI